MWPFLLGLCSVYFFSRSIYRLYFHPLRKFPGPKLAAITYGYEFYFDVVRSGMYIWEVEKMHEKYGPVVRINPRELHIKDPSYYDEIYAPSSKKREKGSDYVAFFGFPQSLIATVGHDHHRFRRGLLNNFFSKKSVLELGPLIHEKVSTLMQRFEMAHHDDAILRLDDAFAALSADVISQYAWGVSCDYLEDKKFNNDMRHALDEIAKSIHVIRFFPVIGNTLRVIPRWLLGMLRPGATAVLDMQDVVARQSAAEKNDGTLPSKTILNALNDPSLPSRERSPRRVEEEGLTLVVAGTETTARTMSVAAFYLYQNKPVLLKLRKELQLVLPTPSAQTSLPALEQLPYLSAVVKEALRLAHAAILRSTRVAPTESLTYNNLVIPPGSPVSMSTFFVHMDPKVFPDPETFMPERWIQSTEQGQNLTKYLVAFSKGSRVCLGMNLAYAEIYMTIASFIRRFDMELYETTMDNVRVGRELAFGQPKDCDFSVRVKVTNVIKE